MRKVPQLDESAIERVAALMRLWGWKRVGGTVWKSRGEWPFWLGTSSAGWWIEATDQVRFEWGRGEVRGKWEDGFGRLEALLMELAIGEEL